MNSEKENNKTREKGKKKGNRPSSFMMLPLLGFFMSQWTALQCLAQAPQVFYLYLSFIHTDDVNDSSPIPWAIQSSFYLS